MRVALVVPLLLVSLAAQVPAPDFRYLQTPPTGLPAMPLPPEPAPTAAMFALGQRLFADPLLSSDRTISCQSCHPPATAFASPDPRPAGVEGRRASAHAPTLLNRGYGKSMRWDGSTATLDAFVVQPIADPNEMNLPVATALQRLRDDAEYSRMFATAFADGVSAANLATALATFVRGIVAADAAVDHFLKGDTKALTREQRAGLWIFESKGGCWRCHTAPLFTDERFHNTGVGAVDGTPQPGRAAHTREAGDAGRFKTPTLRRVSLTAPYMHDGSVRTLADVIEFYARGGNQNHNLSPQLKPLQLSAEDRRNLLAFLESL